MWITCSSFGVIAAQRASSSGISSRCATFRRPIGWQAVLSFVMAGGIRDQGFDPPIMPAMAAYHLACRERSRLNGEFARGHLIHIQH